MQLVGGNGPWEGAIEVKVAESWMSICDPDFNDNDAAVVCRMLGYTGKYVISFSFIV